MRRKTETFTLFRGREVYRFTIFDHSRETARELAKVLADYRDREELLFDMSDALLMIKKIVENIEDY